MLLLVAAAIAIAGSAPTAAAARRPIRVETDVVPDTLILGGVVTLRFRVWLPAGSSSSFPARPPDDSLHHWRRWRAETRQAKGGLREHRLTVDLQPFALGALAVPGPPVRLRVPGEGTRMGRLPTAHFFVRSVLPPGRELPLRGMKALVPPPWWAVVPWWLVAAIVAAAVLAWWLWRRWRARRRIAVEAGVAVPGETPVAEARRRLGALIARHLPEAGRTLEHGTELADILRRFVERRFGSPQPGYTTRELTVHLRGRGDLAATDIQALRDILDACDLTKFARRPYDALRAHAAEETAARLLDAWAEPEPAVDEARREAS